MRHPLLNATQVIKKSGEQRPVPFYGSRRDSIYRISLLNWPILLVIFAIIFVVSPIWQAGYPWGSDSWGHLHRAKFMADQIAQDGLWQGITSSAWMPDWYLGDPTRVYYPPLSNWILGLTTVLTQDVFTAYRVFITGILLIHGVSVYIVSYKWARYPWAAAIAAILAVIEPYTLRTIFSEGNFARGVAILLLPWIVLLTEYILTQRRLSIYMIGLAILWGLTLVAHVMQAAIFAVIIGFYALLRTLSNVYIPVRRSLLSLLPIFLGLGLAGFYLFPAYSKIELSGVPYLPDAKIDIFSISLDAFLPQHASIEAISIGIVTMLVVFAILFRTKKQHQFALFVTGLLAILVAFGERGILYALLPLNQSMLPERFLNASGVLLPLVIGTTANYEIRRRWLIILFLVIVAVEFPSAWRVVHMRDVPEVDHALAEELSQQSLDGRVVTLTPNLTASNIYLMSEVGQRDNVFGWALENTPNHRAFRRLPSAVDHSQSYLYSVLSLWNTDYLIVNSSTEMDVLGEYFHSIAASDSFELWERNTGSYFASILPQNRMLIIGDNPTSWLYSFPFASEGYSAATSDYTNFRNQWRIKSLPKTYGTKTRN